MIILSRKLNKLSMSALTVEPDKSIPYLFSITAYLSTMDL